MNWKKNFFQKDMINNLCFVVRSIIKLLQLYYHRFKTEENFKKWQKQPPRGVLRKAVLKICSKFTGEHPCRSEISIKLFCKLEEKRRHWVCFVYRIVFLSCSCKIKNHSFFCYIMQRIKRTFNIAEVKGEL